MYNDKEQKYLALNSNYFIYFSFTYKSQTVLVLNKNAIGGCFSPCYFLFASVAGWLRNRISSRVIVAVRSIILLDIFSSLFKVQSNFYQLCKHMQIAESHLSEIHRQTLRQEASWERGQAEWPPLSTKANPAQLIKMSVQHKLTFVILPRHYGNVSVLQGFPYGFYWSWMHLPEWFKTCINLQ